MANKRPKKADAKPQRLRKIQLSAHELDGFQQYLFEMDDVLDDLVTDAAIRGIQLDYSPHSLDAFEEYLLAKHAELARLEEHQVDDAENTLINRGGRYVGEVFRRTFGGKWELCAEPRNIHFRTPVLVGFSTKDVDFSPLHAVRMFVWQKNRGFLEEYVMSYGSTTSATDR